MTLRKVKAARRRAAGCDGKERFSSYALAAEKASKAAHRYGAKLGAYHCTSCHGFHVGTKLMREVVKVERDPRKPFAVFAKQGDSVEHYIGRSAEADGGQLKEILARDDWSITRVVEVKR